MFDDAYLRVCINKHHMRTAINIIHSLCAVCNKVHIQALNGLLLLLLIEMEGPILCSESQQKLGMLQIEEGS